MALDQTSLSSGITLTTHGCGENFPVDNTADGVRDPDNRRVEMFFFDEAIDPAPPGKISKKGTTAYPKWLEEVSQTVEVGIEGSFVIDTVSGEFTFVVKNFPLLDIPTSFFISMRKIFGDTLPTEGLDRFRKDLIANEIPPPRYSLSEGLPKNVLGGYSDGTVLLSRELVEQAQTDPLKRWKLFVAYHESISKEVEFGVTEWTREDGAQTTTPLTITLEDLGPDERAKFVIEAQEDSTEVGFLSVNGKRMEGEFFKIEGEGAVHERITREACDKAGVKFDGRMDKGSAWPDVPDFDENSPPVPVPGVTLSERQKKYNSPTANYAATMRMFAAEMFGKQDPNTPAFKSHYGRNQFWHSMSPGSHLTNKQIVDLILKQTEIWWNWAVADRTGTIGIPLPLSILPQGLFHIGKILHTVQDAFSFAHTIRNSKNQIESFQDYSKQDSNFHANHDKDVASKVLHDIPGATDAILHSTEILKLFKKKAAFTEAKDYMTLNVLALAPGFENVASGAIRPDTAPKKK